MDVQKYHQRRNKLQIKTLKEVLFVTYKKRKY